MGAVGRLPDLAPLALALAIGLLIGLERGWRTRGAEAGTRVAGFCTFGLLGLLGGLGAVLPGKPGLALLAAAAALVVAGYVRAAADPHTRSATAALAGLLTIGLGYLAASGQGVEALAAAAGVTLVLASRERVHGAIRGISATEIEAVGRFAIVALVILPLMPDRGLGPYASLNPRQLWFVVVLVLGLNFAGYAAARRLGAGKGLLVTAAAGALVSSTAVTLAYARRLKAPDAPATALAAGISLALLLLFARVLILTAILAGFALRRRHRSSRRAHMSHGVSRAADGFPLIRPGSPAGGRASTGTRATTGCPTGARVRPSPCRWGRAIRCAPMPARVSRRGRATTSISWASPSSIAGWTGRERGR